MSKENESPAVSCELLTDTVMREKLRPIIEYIKEGEPDIKVVLSELEEIVSRSTGEYFIARIKQKPLNQRR